MVPSVEAVDALSADLPAGERQARQAIRRHASEDRYNDGSRQERERRVYGLYATMATDSEIIAIVATEFQVHANTVKRDLSTVRSIVGSWRDAALWEERRNQACTALTDLYSRAIRIQEATERDQPSTSVQAIGQARAVLDQVAKVDGHYAPTRTLGAHVHVHAAPGTVAGMDLRSLSGDERDALRTLLGAGATETPIEVGSPEDPAGEGADPGKDPP